MVDINELNLSTKASNILRRGDDSYGTYNLPHWKGHHSITTVEYLIAQGISGIRNRPGMGKKTLDEIAYKVDIFASMHQIKYNKDEFLKIKEKVKIEVPENYLKNNEKKTGFLYAISAGEEYIKLGRSSHFPSKRLSTIQTGCPLQLRLCGYIELTDDVYIREHYIHSVFKTHHLRGEWFKINYENVKSISKDRDYHWIDFKTDSPTPKPQQSMLEKERLPQQ